MRNEHGPLCILFRTSDIRHINTYRRPKMKCKSFIIFLLLFVAFTNTASEVLKCPGSCMSKEQCKTKKGKIVGYCSNEKPCCDLEARHTGSCNEKIKGLTTAVFQSPMFPAYLKTDLTCWFDFELDINYQAVSIEFVDVYTDGLGYEPHSQCDGGMLIISGFGLWRPVPRCGNLTGYGVLIEKSEETRFLKTLRILGVMSGNLYRWKIKVTQIISKTKTTTALPPLDGELYNVTEIKIVHASSQSTGPVGNRESQITLPAADIENAVVFDDDERSDLNLAEPLIQHGVDTNISQVPWQASLRVAYSEKLLKTANLSIELNKEKGVNCTDIGHHFCGGSVISDQHILTAAHCIEPLNKDSGWMRIDDIRVFLGDTNLCLDDGLYLGQPSHTYSVERITFHYNYDHSHLINDIAVIKLKEKIKFLDYVKPISLPPRFEGSSKKTPSYEGKPAKFSGWGLTNLTTIHIHPKVPFVLQYTEDITVQSSKVCAQMLQMLLKLRTITEKYRSMFKSIVCTNATAGATIAANLGQGDSGGPLFIQEKVKDDPVQIGIASFMIRDTRVIAEQSLIDVYTNVAFFRSWIDFALRI